MAEICSDSYTSWTFADDGNHSGDQKLSVSTKIVNSFDKSLWYANWQEKYFWKSSKENISSVKIEFKCRTEKHVHMGH